jgi:hypothetical protein
MIGGELTDIKSVVAGNERRILSARVIWGEATRQMVKRTKPAAGDGGSRQCIGSGQNHAAETKAPRDTTQAVDEVIVGDRTVGLLNPIIVNENGRLLAGARRLRQQPLRGRR